MKKPPKTQLQYFDVFNQRWLPCYESKKNAEEQGFKTRRIILNKKTKSNDS